MTISKLTILTLPALLFFGCSNTPKDAVDNMYNALQNGNVVKLANNVEESMSILLMAESIKVCSLNKNDYKDNQIKLTNYCLEEMYSGLDYKDVKTNKISEDKAYVEVTVINKNKEDRVTFTVQKIDGKWMVSGRKRQ